MAGYQIEILAEASCRDLSEIKIKRTAQKILKALGWKKAALSIWLVNDRKMSRLNWRYMRHKGPTDILSFSQLEGKSLPTQEQIPFLGDLIISLDTTARQAKEYGNNFFYEFSFYLCHGILHLMGWQDNTAKAAKRMERKQTVILKKIRVRATH